MVFLITHANRRRFESDLLEMHRQRKVVFVDRAGWRVPVMGDLEIDRYDRKDTIYLLAKEQRDGQVLASVRLLPTTGPHLMTDLFTAACAGAVPRGPAIWEVSRFCSNDVAQGRRMRLALVWEMACAVMETALLFGVRQVTLVANGALLPLVLKCGWQAQPLGPTLPDGDDELTAVAAAITPDGLCNVRRRLGINGPVTRFVTSAMSIAA